MKDNLLDRLLQLVLHKYWHFAEELEEKISLYFSATIRIDSKQRQKLEIRYNRSQCRKYRRAI